MPKRLLNTASAYVLVGHLRHPSYGISTHIVTAAGVAIQTGTGGGNGGASHTGSASESTTITAVLSSSAAVSS